MSRKIKKIKRSEGFSLLELVLAVAIFSFSSFALATMIIDSNISTRLSADKTDALFYAKEGVEAVRSIRDNDWTAWASTTDGNYGLSINEASSTWEFSGESDLIDNKYTRTVNIVTDSDVPTSKDVTVNIAWDLTPGRIASTTLLTIFSNWPDVINSSLAVPRGLVSYYSFDDAGAGTAGDSIGGNDGTVTGATATTSVKGIANQAYSFNGLSGLVNGGNVLNFEYNQPFTISWWAKTTNKFIMYIGKMPNMSHNTKGWTLFRSDGQVEYFQFNAGTSYTDDEIQVYSGSGNLADGNWHHHVFTYDGSLKAAGCDFWFDGVSQRGIGNFWAGSDTLSGTKSTIDTNVDFMMGASAGGYYLNGAMDNVRIYRRAITADEVTTIYNSEKP